MNFDHLGKKALQGMVLDREECLAVLRCPEDQILELLQAAYQVRHHYFGKKVVLQLLINAKSGLCTEDCAYCSQSATSNAEIDQYSLLDEERILQGAYAAKVSGAQRYCVVTSGYSPSPDELDRLCYMAQHIKQEMDIELCNSLGHLTEEAARKLKAAGVDRYNHNLNTSARLYPKICTTHTYEDRVETLQNARKAGLALCCGALLGMGEAEDDIIDLALALREVAPDSIPVNFLNPIQGTQMEGQETLTPLQCLSILSLMRFLNPQTEIRAAGGRERRLRTLQAMALYPANSIFVAGYLTTDGQSPQEAQQMINDMGFEIEEEPVHKS